MEMIYVLTFFIREGALYREMDLKLAHDCFLSLEQCGDIKIIIHNQGCLTNEQLKNWLTAYKVDTEVIGNGENIGIAEARQRCFEHIWRYYPNTPYICEIHIDMVFHKEWQLPLLNFLKDSDEPLIAPGVVTLDGTLYPLTQKINGDLLPKDFSEFDAFLKQLKCEAFVDAFVNPVIYKSDVLKEIGGYDCLFLRGKQGYEDDSLLLGFLYYMGTRTNWKPKCYLKSWVFHATAVQRMTLPGKEKEFARNLNGLFCQYGANGFKQLSRLRTNSTEFELFFENVVNSL